MAAEEQSNVKTRVEAFERTFCSSLMHRDELETRGGLVRHNRHVTVSDSVMLINGWLRVHEHKHYRRYSCTVSWPHGVPSLGTELRRTG